MVDRFKMIASGYLVLIKDRKILLGRRQNTGYEDGKYGLPAGHIEEHETITKGTAREIKEEIGITISRKDLILSHVMHRKGNDERMDFFFTVSHWRGKIKNEEPEKCDDLRWFPLNILPKNTIPYIRAAIKHCTKKQIYSEFGWNKK